nr:cytochrome P450 [uncultured Caldimonas sp.]
MQHITDPVAAVTAADPYPYYASLRAASPCRWNEPLKLWVASSAEAVEAALAHPGLYVRPQTEPVPRGIAGTPAGTVFSKLARMNDGPAHAAARRALTAHLAALPAQAVPGNARRHAQQMLPRDARALDRWIFQVPLLAMAESLGVPDAALAQVAAHAHSFVAGLSPLGSASQLAAAGDAAQALLQCFDGGIGAWAGPVPHGVPRDIWAANLVGLLSQTCEATAGLLGNTLVAFARESGLFAMTRDDVALLVDAIDEVARHDPSIQNTRRFAHDEAIELLGQRIGAHEAVLVLLASANRDDSAQPHAERFMLQRGARRQHGFGAGRHQCPGTMLAAKLAQGAMSCVDEAVIDIVREWQLHPRYRPSVNARIPHFHQETPA